MVRYRWEGGETQDSPVPLHGSVLTLLVADRVVWHGDVLEELRAWARWCALRVLHWWEIEDVVSFPQEIRVYLETGDEGLQEGARARAYRSNLANFTPARNAAQAVLCAATDRFEDAAWYSARADVSSDGLPKERPDDARDQLQQYKNWLQQRTEHRVDQLRRLLLQRVLPEELWALIDGAGGVLCDALLEDRHRG